MHAIFNREIVYAVQGTAVIIVTGATGSAIRHQAPVTGLGCVRVVFLMAGLAIPDVLRPDESRPVVQFPAVADDLVIGLPAEWMLCISRFISTVLPVSPSMDEGL